MFTKSPLTQALAAAAILAAVTAARGQAAPDNMPKIVTQNGRHAFFVDGAPFFMLGGQTHNSSAWPGMMPRVWAAVEAMHANTVEMPVYWEQIEAVQGKYDFSVVDALLQECRQHKVRWVPLWFATWKNGSAHYLPEWMKLEAGVKYPNIKGRNGNPVDSPSPHNTNAMELDAKAFAAFMTHLKEVDPQHTVIMVQVENESGAWGSIRDYSPTAQKIFDGPVPAEMLKPELLKELKVNPPTAPNANWQTVFGNDADEFFQAYHVSHYVGQVAAAGKAAYPLPLYANCALRDPLSNPRAGSYESGGPTDNVIPIWRSAAPALDLVAPDIYLSDSPRQLKFLDLYDRPDNPLLVPEIGGGAEYGRMLFATMAHGAIGFAPFGIDDNGRGNPGDPPTNRLSAYSANYAILTPMIRQLAQWNFEGKLKAACERDDRANQTLDLGNWQANANFTTGGGGRGGAGGARRGPATATATGTAGGGGRRGATTAPADSSAGAAAPGPAPAAYGQLLVAQLGANELLCVGSNVKLTFRPIGPNAGKEWHYLRVEEGNYENGAFKLLRIWNGDETDGGGPSFPASPVVLHITLYTR